MSRNLTGFSEIFGVISPSDQSLWVQNYKKYHNISFVYFFVCLFVFLFRFLLFFDKLIQTQEWCWPYADNKTAEFALTNSITLQEMTFNVNITKCKYFTLDVHSVSFLTFASVWNFGCLKIFNRSLGFLSFFFQYYQMFASTKGRLWSFSIRVSW